MTVHRAHRKRTFLLATASLIALDFVFVSTSALADGGNGGGVPAAGVGGGAGGVGFTGAPDGTGGNGRSDGSSTGGGGGGAAGGGNGGSGGAVLVGSPAAGGDGGTALSRDGEVGRDGDSTSGGGGGGGGGGYNGNGAGAVTITNTAPLTGGRGGAGGNGMWRDAGGGGGGGGGYGAIVTGSSVSTNASTISGGAGAAGGAGFGSAAVSGNGGDGGVGVQFTTSGATFTNTGTVTGGNGGAGGAGTSGAANGVAGAGGTGIVGAGLTIINGGTVMGGLSGDGTRANAITFTGGSNVLELQAGSTITGNVVGTGSDTLRLGGSTNGSFDVSTIGAAVQYQGFSTFVKTGSSMWTLTGTNTAALPWSITAGTLTVDGTLANAPMTVNNGGTLVGTGTTGGVTVAGGGTLAPGNAANPTGTLTITGNLAFQSGALYLAQVTPSAAASTNVRGTATLGGASVNAVFANGNYVNKTYTILTASGGVSGTFASNTVNTNLPANFSTSLSYDANNAYLDLSLNYTPGPTAPNFGSGLSRNQQAVADALINSFNANGGIPLVYGALSAAGLTQASGELGTSSQQTTFGAMTQFMGLLTDPFAGRTGWPGATSGAAGFAEVESASGYAARKRTDAFAMFTKAPPSVVQRWSVWASGFGGSQSTDGNAVTGSNNTTSSIFGTAVGADYLFAPNTLAGFSLAGGGTSFSVNGLGSGRSDLFQAGAYVRHTNGPAYISAALAYGWQDITTDRIVTISGVDHLRAEFNANAYSGRAEGGYRFVSPWSSGIGLTPYAAAQFTTFDLPAYAESVVSGSGAFALAYGAKSPTDTRSELGLRTDKSIATQDGVLTLRGRLAWAHDFNPDRSIAPTFQALPGASFVVNGAAQASDSALTTAAAEMKWINGWSAAATFDGEFSNVTRSYAGKGVVRYTW